VKFTFGTSAIGLILLVIAIPFATTAQSPAPKSQPQPVEKDMHEFMEYAFEPGYKRLKPLMANPPTNNAGWKGIKADSLSLAEGGNLLLARIPKEDAEKWIEWSSAVRASGGELYQAAKKKDFDAASRHYKTLLTKCNACHTHFANGEHQLSPN